MCVTRFLVAVVFLLTPVIGFSQTDTLSSDSGLVYAFADVAPVFPGGEEKLLEFISATMQYPEESKKKEHCGTGYVTFTVGKTGVVYGVKTVRAIDLDMEKEALRIVKLMPAWSPAIYNGKAVAYQVNIPVVFHLEGCVPKSNGERFELEVKQKDAVELVKKGNEAREAEHYDIAEKFYTRALGFLPSADILFNRALARLGQGNDQGFCGDLYIASLMGDAQANNMHKEYCKSFIPTVYFADTVSYCSELDANPEFPGGEMEEMKFLAVNLKYPDSAKEKEISGTVFLSFTVDVDGTLSNFQVLRSPDKALEIEAMRVVQLMPKFSPGIIDGRPVKVQCNLPVKFDLR